MTYVFGGTLNLTQPTSDGWHWGADPTTRRVGPTRRAVRSACVPWPNTI